MAATHKSRGIVFVRSTSIISDSRILKEAEAAKKRGYNVIILGWDRENNNKSKDLKLNSGLINLNLFHLKSGYGNGIRSFPKLFLFQIWIFFQLLFLCRKYTIIHSCDLDTAIPCLFVAKLFRKKIVYDIFDYYIHSHNIPTRVKFLVENIEVFVINCADAVIICSESRYKQIEKSKPKKVEVIHNTPDIVTFTDKNTMNRICKSTSKRLKVVYVGILQDKRLLKEIIEILPEFENIELHIGGFGVLQDLLENINYKNLYYYGILNYNQVLQLESECDVIFATYDPKVENHKFSAPNKLYEAMALKKPIIVCKNTGIDEVVYKYDMGLVIEYNAIEFFNALKLLDNRTTRKRLGNNGRNAYNVKFNWRIMEDRLIKLYWEILEV